MEPFSGIVPKFPQLNPGYSKTIPGMSPMFNPGQKGILYSLRFCYLNFNLQKYFKHGNQIYTIHMKL